MALTKVKGSVWDSSDQELYFSVKDFGARGDGATDDTSAIQAAVDAANSATGGTVFFPTGTYVTGPIYIPYDNIHLIGAGPGASIIKLKDSPSADQFSTLAFGISSNQTTTVQASNCSVRHLEIDGNKSNQFEGSAAENGVNGGITCWLVDNFLVDHCVVHDCDGYNIGLVGSTETSRTEITVTNCVLYNGNYDGLDIKSDAQRVYLHNIVAYDNGGGPIASRDGIGIDFRGQHVVGDRLVVWGNQTGGIRLRINMGDTAAGKASATLNNCYSLGNTTLDGFTINGPADAQYALTNCFAEGEVRYGFNHDNGVAVLSNCHARECGDAGFFSDCTDANGALSIVGGSAVDNDDFGVLTSNTTCPIHINNLIVQRNGLDGVNLRGAAGSSTRLVNCTISDNSQTTATTYDNIEFSNNAGPWSLIGCYIAGSSVNGGISFNGTNAAGKIIGCDFDVTTPLRGTIPTGTRLHENDGYVTSNLGLASSVTPDGSGEVEIAHGCDVTPNVMFVNLRGDNINSVDAVSVDAANITARIKDSSGADVTSGTFDIDWKASRVW